MPVLEEKLMKGITIFKKSVFYFIFYFLLFFSLTVFPFDGKTFMNFYELFMNDLYVHK